jgi:hypothetical protein
VRAFRCSADRDYIVEVTDSGAANARRVNVGAPPPQPAVRAPLEQLLAGQGFSGPRINLGGFNYLGGPPPSNKPRTFNGSKAVPLDFICWRFFDVSHQVR